MANGDDVLIPTLPKASMINSVEVAVPAVVVPTARKGYGLGDEAAYSERSAYGVDVPIPTKPANVEVAVVLVATIAETVGVPVADRLPVDVQKARVLGEPLPVCPAPTDIHTPFTA